MNKRGRGYLFLPDFDKDLLDHINDELEEPERLFYSGAMINMPKFIYYCYHQGYMDLLEWLYHVYDTDDTMYIDQKSLQEIVEIHNGTRGFLKKGIRRRWRR